jgi:multiple sugar transport system substrate-binding protein
MVAPVVAIVTLTACGVGEPQPSPGDDGAGGGSDVSDEELEGTSIKLARFFGDCDETTSGVTDVSEATSECEVIQILTNAFNAENEFGITVERLGGAEWGTYYDALNAAFAGGNPPDVAVMHGSNLPDYAARNLLLPLDDVAEVDLEDAAEAARDAVTYEDTTYALPFDLHAALLHVNMDILNEAGLVDAQGNPMIPTSVDEFFAAAKQVEDRTGKQFFGAEFVNGLMGIRMFISLVWQQGGDIVSADGTSAQVDGPEARAALDMMLRMFDEGYANPEQTYDSAQQAFLNGDVALLMNGTWVVNQYDAEAPFDYRTADFPTLFDSPAVWANSHVWVIPRQEQADPVRYRAALEFISYLYEHEADWAIGTGHLAARTPVLESADYQQAPQRANYVETATSIARQVPRVRNWQAVEDILRQQIEATWLTGVSVDEALSQAQREIDRALAD